MPLLGGMHNSSKNDAHVSATDNGEISLVLSKRYVIILHSVTPVFFAGFSSEESKIQIFFYYHLNIL